MCWGVFFFFYIAGLFQNRSTARRLEAVVRQLLHINETKDR